MVHKERHEQKHGGLLIHRRLWLEAVNIAKPPASLNKATLTQLADAANRTPPSVSSRDESRNISVSRKDQDRVFTRHDGLRPL